MPNNNSSGAAQGLAHHAARSLTKIGSRMSATGTDASLLAAEVRSRYPYACLNPASRSRSGFRTPLNFPAWCTQTRGSVTPQQPVLPKMRSGFTHIPKNGVGIGGGDAPDSRQGFFTPVRPSVTGASIENSDRVRPPTKGWWHSTPTNLARDRVHLSRIVHSPKEPPCT